MSHLVYPSVLSADLSNLESTIKLLNASEADAIHVDIMDGVFVPNISFGFPVLNAIKKISTKPIDVHLMIVNPELYIERFIKTGANSLLIHYESNVSLYRTLQNIKSLGAKAGVVLNPHTPVSLLEDFIQDLDTVLIMSVNPGYGGQNFISWSYQKIEKLKNLIISKNSKTLIEVDGGVNASNAPKIVRAGADILVAGDYIFKSSNPISTIAEMKKLL